MSKRAYISRYLLIVKKLKAKSFSTFEELQSCIGNQFEYLRMLDDTLEIGFSKRTLQRDLKEIRNLFGVDIEYSKSSNGYFISQNETDNMNFQRMMEAFDMFNSLNLARDLTPFVHLEKRRSQGTENLYGLLHAIKNKKSITFNYYKYWEDILREKTVHPFALKESQGRWYLLAVDPGDKNLKTFGLDRISDLVISKKSFKDKYDFNVKELFLNSFGILNPENKKPQKIRLSFTYEQGQYVKNFPLHYSQKVTEEDNEVIIELFIIITYDFVMELLSYGEEVTILSPKSLKTRMKKIYTNALSKYS